LASDEPYNDLELFKNLFQYETINKTVARAAIHKFENHLWYLGPELAAFSLFSDKVSEKQKMLLRIKSTSNNSKKRDIRPRKINDIQNKKLSDFVTPSSMLTLRVLLKSNANLLHDVD
jgi:hypothetical protein